MRRAILPAAAVLAALVFAPSADAAEGLPDPTFGSGGFTLLDEPALPDEFLDDVIVLPDGKILAGGGRGGSTGFLLARFNPDGTPDLSFGPDGIRVEPYTGNPDEPRGINRIARQGDGKLVAAGLGHATMADAFAVARYQASGQLDLGFGDSGLKVLEPEGPGEGQGMDLAPGGKIVVSGYRIADGIHYEPTVLRLTSEGDPDPTFAAAPPVGFAHFKLPDTESAQASAVSALGDGSLVTGGWSEAGAWLAKLDTEGKLETEFGNAGFAIQNFGTPTDITGEFEDIAVQPDGRIVAVGTAAVGPENEQLVAARFTSGGDLDTGFGSGGLFTLDPTPSDDFATALALLPDGRIVISGGRNVFDDTNSGDTWLVRLTANGQLDPSFGAGGQATASASPGIDIAYGVALQPDGRTVTVGEAPGPGSVEGPYQLLAGRFTGPEPEPVKVSLIPTRAPRCGGRKATVVGSAKSDKLKGTKKADVIAGLGGADTIKAVAGNDVVCGGGGRDMIQLGKGRDRAFGEGGPDRILGGPGKDQLLGAEGSDLLSGGPGRDVCNGGAGRDADPHGCEQRKKIP
jgi:uncharacterized delta-60 repeat protein